MGNDSVDVVSIGDRVDYRQLAEEIYDLDKKVYETLGSSLGRVFNDDRERCIARMVTAMEDTPEEHIVRSAVVLIGNMARTIPNRKARSAIMAEYNDIMQKLLKISVGFVDSAILDRRRARLNSLTLGSRFGETNRLIICISRTYGSGGNDIGFGLADALKINYYDAEIFQNVLKNMEAEQDGLTDHSSYGDLKIRRKKSNPGLSPYREQEGFLEKLRKVYRYHGLPTRDAVFFNQSDLILDLARTQDFVVMGRCADVVLRNNHIPHISIFITAPFEKRVQRMMDINQVDAREARRQLKQVDHEHASYYHFYTGYKWGDANHYDLCINSASYGIKGSIDFILNMLRANEVRLPHTVG